MSSCYAITLWHHAMSSCYVMLCSLALVPWLDEPTPNGFPFPWKGVHGVKGAPFSFPAHTQRFQAEGELFCRQGMLLLRGWESRSVALVIHPSIEYVSLTSRVQGKVVLITQPSSALYRALCISSACDNNVKGWAVKSRGGMGGTGGTGSDDYFCAR